ncbi:MAG: 4-hydroxy-3-methylbut-2-enyl diphosphate reductase [Deltaproteobacteria bacterium]|nr:4-hydroxy-3-methylbut-2-enyl diphosphate reductase [Deltaproteobacteria bacterium]
MEIFVAKSSGFCFGVKRAINIATDCAEHSCGGIYTLGPIIHNPQVVKRLEQSHVYEKSDVEDIESGTVIIRSHGVRLDEYERAKQKGLDVVDATCPFVKKAQEIVSLLSDEGYVVVVAGEKDHPEVKGLVSYGASGIRVADSPEAISDMPRCKKIGVVAQTTLPLEKFEDIVSACLAKTAELKVYNTICNATSVRQKESAELSRKADCMIVVGGRNSANTRRLAEICRQIQPKTHHIEVADEFNAGWLDGAETVGITSGASTPDWVIEAVVERIRSVVAAEKKLQI